MRLSPIAALAAGAAIVLATSVAADSGAPGGSDREPAGGAYRSSFPEVQPPRFPSGSPPRSVDVPRGPDGVPLGRYPGSENGNALPLPYWAR